MAEPSALYRVAEFSQPMTIKKLPKFVVGAMLVGVTASTFAVSLGRMRGTAIVGRAFDVTLVARLGSGEQLSDLCVGAEVFFGDSRISSARISTAVGANAGEVLIRVRTAAAVDEPVVTVHVREGCVQKNTRKYVFLAEVLTGEAGDLAVTSGEVAGSSPVQLPTLGELGSKAAQTTGSAAAAALPGLLRKKPFADRTSPTKAAADRLGGMSARVAAKAALESSSKTSRSRLKLDPLELGAERDPVLRATSEMLTLPSTDPQQRASAAALWQAINAQPLDMLRDSERLKTLEMNVAKMLAQSRATDMSASDLRAQLEQSRAERFSNWLIYTLAAALFLSWLIAAYLLTRSRREYAEESASTWWRKGLAPDDRSSVDGAPEPLTDSTGRMTDAGRLRSGFLGEETEPLLATAKSWNNVPPAARFKTIAPIEAKDRVEFSISLPSMTGMPRIVNAEELFDVQQQADFFVSLGDFDKAIEVLRNHIADNVETSAVAYLDLFDLYHQLGRSEEYEALSDDFSRMFNAQVPVFDSYKAATQGLEYYEAALSRIVALWPMPKVLEVIEESIFRKPDSNSVVFSLAAYRELLLLHAIAKKVVEPSDPRKTAARNAVAKSTPSAYAHTTIQPLSAHLQDLPKLHALGQGEKVVDPTRPPASRHLGLDIDLNFDLADLHGKPEAITRGLSAQETPASFTHELLEYDVFPVDPKAR